MLYISLVRIDGRSLLVLYSIATRPPMFRTLRRKATKSDDDDNDAYVRVSPSLPELSAQGIGPWPENLVDIAAIKQTSPPEVPIHGATKTSFQSPDSSPIRFHKPFRGAIGKTSASSASTTKGPNGTISSLYTSYPPTSFGWRNSVSSQPASPAVRATQQRRGRVAPTFNIMVSRCASVYGSVIRAK